MDHSRRLEALLDLRILDTPPEPVFDDIVAIAQKMCETPVALVSLLAEGRQWFKARVGLDACEMPLDQSVCVHTLSVDDLLVIPDLTQDPRTKTLLAVTAAPFLRFYAGAKLSTLDGVPIGSLCVLDSEPRPGGLTPDQKEVLLALGRQTMAIMSLRGLIVEQHKAVQTISQAGQASRDRVRYVEAESAQARSNEVRLTSAQEAGGIGTFEIDTTTDVCRVSAEFCRLFGLPVAPTYQVAELHAQILDADRTLLSTQESRAEGGALREIEFRLRRANDGVIRWLSRRADFRTDAAGDVTSMVGVAQDITDRKLSEMRAAAIVRLGDKVRDATSSADIVEAAACLLGENLAASRAGFAKIDTGLGELRIEREWLAPGVASVVGVHSTARLRNTVARLEDDLPMTIANVPGAAWLGDDLSTYASFDVRAFIKVPLVQRGRLVGVLFVHNVQPRTWSVVETDFALAVADRTYAALAKIQAEAQQLVLNQELSHRLKNTLSMVQALVVQTLRGVKDRSVVATLESRIIALSKAHDVLLQQSWSAAPMTTVIRSVLELHDQQDRIEIVGPSVTLGPKATLSTSLLLHELATNAVKYGALSSDAGRVAINWTVKTDGGEPHLHLSWRESGGPPVTAPPRRGFGSRLIAMGLVGAGKTRLDYAPDGLRADFPAPMRLIGEV